jgi:hypothetical protein
MLAIILVVSACSQYVKTQEQLNGFQLNLIPIGFNKIFEQIPRFLEV